MLYSSSSSSPTTCSGPCSAFGTREYHFARGVVIAMLLRSSFAGALRPVVAYKWITNTMSAYSRNAILPRRQRWGETKWGIELT